MEIKENTSTFQELQQADEAFKCLYCFRIFNNHIYMKWSPNKDNQSLMAKMIYKDNDPELRSKFAAMIKSVLYSIIYVLE